MQLNLDMKHLIRFVALIIFGTLLYSCGISSNKTYVGSKKTEKPVVVSNDSLEYEVIIFDVGFNNYLNTQARPRGFYSQNYLERWNNIYITNWNIRHQNPKRYDANIYQNLIDYDAKIDYGYEVNYKLFNYFQFAQIKYRMRLDTDLNTPDRIR